MKGLSTLIAHEYKTSLKSKSFWISTLIFPLIFIAFGMFIGFLAEDSKSLHTMANPVQQDESEMTGIQVLGLMCGTLLTLMVMICGAQIFTKVKSEKSNRIMEIIATSIPGRTMMMAKVFGCGLVGLTQILIWVLFVAAAIIVIMITFRPSIDFAAFLDWKVIEALLWAFLFFIGGFLFYGSLYAAFGSLSDKNNENQEYMTFLTFVLLAAFYISQYCVDNPDSILAAWCSYIPFTSSSVCVIRSVCGAMTIWETLLSLVILYLFSYLSMLFAGKIYSAGILMRGAKLSPKQLMTFFKMK